MAIVFDHHYLTIADGKTSHICKTPANALEPGQDIYYRSYVHTQLPGDRNSAQCITHIVWAGQIQADRQCAGLIGKMHIEMHHPALLLQSTSTDVCFF